MKSGIDMPYKQRVTGSNPVTPTLKEAFIERFRPLLLLYRIPVVYVEFIRSVFTFGLQVKVQNLICHPSLSLNNLINRLTAIKQAPTAYKKALISEKSNIYQFA